MSDYSEHLLAARKALKTAEAWALHGDKRQAIEAADMAAVHAMRMAVALGAVELGIAEPS